VGKRGRFAEGVDLFYSLERVNNLRPRGKRDCFDSH
jgi:hypothetical protein